MSFWNRKVKKIEGSLDKVIGDNFGDTISEEIHKKMQELAQESLSRVYGNQLGIVQAPKSNPLPTNPLASQQMWNSLTAGGYPEEKKLHERYFSEEEIEQLREMLSWWRRIQELGK